MSETLRERIAEQAHHRCGYCLTQEVVSGIPLTLEHIIPRAKGGQDVEEKRNGVYTRMALIALVTGRA